MFLFKAIGAASLVLFCSGVYAQMPGWATIRDRDGNKYYVDRNFKIHVDGEPGAAYKPVSLESLEFNLEQSHILLKNHRSVEALRILKGIMILASQDNRASGAGVKASKALNTLKRREKDRYTKLDHDSALFTVKRNTTIDIYNNWMDWSFQHDGAVQILARKSLEQHNYARDGVTVGLSIAETTDKGFDMLMSINCEEILYPLGHVSKYIELTRNKNPDDTAPRTSLEISDTRTLSRYSFSGDGGIAYSALELFAIKRNRGYHVQIFTPQTKAAATEKAMRTIVDSFLVKGRD